MKGVPGERESELRIMEQATPGRGVMNGNMVASVQKN